jgi:hypothetical protein
MLLSDFGSVANEVPYNVNRQDTLEYARRMRKQALQYMPVEID